MRDSRARVTEQSGMALPFFDHFADLPDPRIDRSKEHPLLNIVFIALCTLIGGGNDFCAMERFGKAKRAWLEKYLDLSHGIPSHDTFNRVLSLLAPAAFLDCFLSWVEALQQGTADQVVSIDGKTARATLDRAKAKHPLHVVAAWVSANHLLLGQVTVDEKSNEITAIPKLLALLELEGAIVTPDAMGCQKEIAEQIRDQRADYVLAVKGNQEHLFEDVVAHFSAVDEGRKRASPRSVAEQEDVGHGRREYRRYEALPVPKGLRHRADWADLKSLCRVTRCWEERGESKSEVRYFISSLEARAEPLAAA